MLRNDLRPAQRRSGMNNVARDPAAAAISASQARRKQVTLGNAMYEQPCAVRGAQQESKRPVS
jgi:hypothetical protein